MSTGTVIFLYENGIDSWFPFPFSITFFISRSFSLLLSPQPSIFRVFGREQQRASSFSFLLNIIFLLTFTFPLSFPNYFPFYISLLILFPYYFPLLQILVPVYQFIIFLFSLLGPRCLNSVPCSFPFLLSNSWCKDIDIGSLFPFHFLFPNAFPLLYYLSLDYQKLLRFLSLLLFILLYHLLVPPCFLHYYISFLWFPFHFIFLFL